MLCVLVTRVVTAVSTHKPSTLEALLHRKELIKCED